MMRKESSLRRRENMMKIRKTKTIKNSFFRLAKVFFYQNKKIFIGKTVKSL